MTCREALALEHPDKITNNSDGGCFGCPGDYGYLDNDCHHYTCAECWNRELPEGYILYIDPETLNNLNNTESFRHMIIRMIRERFGLAINERFQFVNQKSDAIYFFTENALMKNYHGYGRESGVSINWLVVDECEIKRVGGYNA